MSLRAVLLVALLMGSTTALAPTAFAQRSRGSAAGATAVPTAQGRYAEFEAQFKDKGWSREIIELFMAINVDRATYDRVQRKTKHSDEKLIRAARDTRDLGLTGRQNLEDISNSSRQEIDELRRHALGAKAGKSDKKGGRR